MMKIFRIFFSDLDKQENWLNEKAKQGLRLTKTTKLFYYFEQCEPSEFTYKVELITDRSLQEQVEYRRSLGEDGIRTFTKNYAFGRIAYGKATLNLAGKIRVRTAPGTINSEILILEKKTDGKSFELFTDKNDKISYYKKVRNTFTLSIIGILIVVIVSKPRGLNFLNNEQVPIVISYVVKGLGIAICIPLLITVSKAMYRLRQLKKETTPE
ncbi:DUF2812 domain-containing protein [Paenibacillus donghaensis]|uniref:DUF2812 domain-containing protein n=1 Tax=Paenibacillus donghaensis TaxID=414771 RepID=A0A2Z2KM72_9BACL|nr:DUF2812 domain-containing protein [Paenibacillus donghaensis]ASA25485.1 hypothetical protein B9T62_35000 [Paenibacillus donghaensis]